VARADRVDVSGLGILFVESGYRRALHLPPIAAFDGCNLEPLPLRRAKTRLSCTTSLVTVR
jgi:hypothetical protein